MTLWNEPKGAEQHVERLQTVFPSHISEGTRDAFVQLCMHAASQQEEQYAFAKQCLDYARHFIDRYPQVAEALFLGEELGGKGKQNRMHQKALEDYPGKDLSRDVRRGDLWNGAGEHTMAVGMFAEILAKKMKLPEEAVRRVALAGGVHDWWKKRQIIHMWDAEDALAQQGTPVTRENQDDPKVIAAIRSAFDAARLEDIQGLRTLDFPEDVITLAGQTTSHDVLNVQTDEQLILFYLDHVMAGVRPSDMLSRIRNAVNGNPSYRAYELSYKDELGGKDGHSILLEDSKAREIQRRLADRIGYTGDLDHLHDHLVDLFVEAVRGHTATQ
jgi:hypothetical protein